MSAVAASVARGLSRTLGVRAFTVSAATGDKVQLGSDYVTLKEAQNKRGLFKLDPIYDDVEENSSVINLWKRQKAAELNADASAMSHIDELVRKEHNIFEVPDDFQRPYPKYPPPKGAVISDDGGDMVWSADLKIPYEEFRRLAKKTLIVKRTVQMTRKGKMPSMYAMVVVGNGRGSAGYGEGKSDEAAKAVLFATRAAIKNMSHFPRYDERTLYHDIEHKFKATKLFLWARRPGFGCRVSPVIHNIFECVGIHDIAGKVHGSRNPMNVIKAVFEALKKQRIPSDLAKARGLRLVDVNHTYYQGIRTTPVGRSKF